jgi:ATP-dependent Clp protease ATP-binding subunit ClpA
MSANFEFDKETGETLERARALAIEKRHEYVCLEHLLAAIIESSSGAELLQRAGVETSELRKRLEDFFLFKLHTLPEGTRYEPFQTLGLQRVVQSAVLHTQFSSSDRLTVGDLMVSLFNEKDSHAVFFLEEVGASKLTILEALTDELEEQSELFGEPAEDEEMAEESGTDKDPLARYTTELTEKARTGELDPLIGRDSEIERAIQVLSRRTKNNPLFVGDQGVGKTALVEGIAQRIVAGEVPTRMKQFRIFSLDLGGLLAGTRYRGDFEQRLKGVMKRLEQIPGAVLFIDEIHTIIGAGATSGTTLDAANILKPALSKMRCIGSTTFDEYKTVFEKDRALARRFLKIEVLEPSVEDTIKILQGLRSRFEEHHGVRYTPAALKTAVELSAKFINERFLPDKAIDVLDEAGAVVSLRGEKKNTASQTVSPTIIEEVVAKIARIPPQSVTTSERERLAQLEGDLLKVVFGQDEAVRQVAQAVRRARAGLSQERKPIGSFLFVGPTGVGKTEVSKQLAKTLGLELIRFDMSEYQEKHAVSRFIGAPPGYVGHEQGGQLTDAIIRHPHAVLLLDEIEKAHPDIFNILLQVMDNAQLTDSTGRKADFRNAIIILTSNVGSESIHGRAIGFANDTPGVGLGAVEKAFLPEFRNRLDAIVRFNALPLEIAERIVEKFIDEVRAQLLPKGVSLVVSPNARRHFVERGFSPQYGARSLGRLIQAELKDKLADAILFGELQKGGLAEIDYVNDELKVTFCKVEARKKGQDQLARSQA